MIKNKIDIGCLIIICYTLFIGCEDRSVRRDLNRRLVIASYKGRVGEVRNLIKLGADVKYAYDGNI